MDLLALADDLWAGKDRYKPFDNPGAKSEIDDNTLFVHGFANVNALLTEDGIVLIDTGSSLMAKTMHDSLRTWSTDRINTAVFTHGHIDHCFGIDNYDSDNASLGSQAPKVVAHEAIRARFDRYKVTAGYNEQINRRQFGMSDFVWPLNYRYPDITYQKNFDLLVGGEKFELHHARGETDDHTWVWAPDRSVVCVGDLFTWAAPNCGNPQKVQRYPMEWAQALREIATLNANVMLPGHGLPIIGPDRVRQALEESAELLEYLHTETLILMNAGATLNDIIHSVKAPERLLERPYLRPVYDDPEFILHSLWRLYGGWFDGNPARLKPPSDKSLAVEVAALAGGPVALSQRALLVADSGDLRLAGQLIEWALGAYSIKDPDRNEVAQIYSQINRQRVAQETSLMAKGVFRAAAREPNPKANAPEN